MDARLVGPITLVLALACTTALGAQADTSATPPAPAPKRHRVCWVPMPDSRCGGYVVTEMAFEKPFRSPDDDLVGRLGWTFGAMINAGPRDAVGVLGSWMESGRRPGVVRVDGRYRRWFSERTGLDLTLGFAKYNVAALTEPPVRMRGMTAAAAVEYKMFGIESRVDRVRGAGREATSVTVGVRAGGPAAPLTALATYVVLLVWVFHIDPPDTPLEPELSFSSGS